MNYCDAHCKEKLALSYKPKFIHETFVSHLKVFLSAGYKYKIGSDLESSGEGIFLTISQDSFQGISGQSMKFHRYKFLEYLVRLPTT